MLLNHFAVATVILIDKLKLLVIRVTTESTQVLSTQKNSSSEHRLERLLYYVDGLKIFADQKLFFQALAL